jgi:hypothetical protein
LTAILHRAALARPCSALDIAALVAILAKLDAVISSFAPVPHTQMQRFRLQELRDTRDCTVNMIARARLTAGGAL